MHERLSLQVGILMQKRAARKQVIVDEERNGVRKVDLYIYTVGLSHVCVIQTLLGL